MAFIKRFFKGLYMSFSMFCTIPLPFKIWDDASANLMLPMFPLVGVLVGVLWWGVAHVLMLTGIHVMLTSAIFMLMPFLATGFLHLDGYMDTSDAILSRRPLEDKLRILKDPNAGAFSVIMLAVLFILQFAASFAVIENGRYFILLIVITVVSRCCSGLSGLCLKTLEQSGYVNMFRQGAGGRHKICLIVIAAIAFAFAYFIAGFYGISVAALTVAGFVGAMAYAYFGLKGVSGDLMGFALVISELCGLVALSVMWR
ncbi:MAG: adenosylcobinamide-GDP ribazoletransferase [Oscillospiraceae bacterium]|nr:adenosylcobinamide-GDP ribazoletransferase [Oscillospiraceae bacterium]